jgi:hypothetical protein
MLVQTCRAGATTSLAWNGHTLYGADLGRTAGLTRLQQQAENASSGVTGDVTGLRQQPP